MRKALQNFVTLKISPFGSGSQLLLGNRRRRLNTLASIGTVGSIRVNRRALIELGSKGGRDRSVRARTCSRPSREVRTKSTRYAQMHTRTGHAGFPRFARHFRRHWRTPKGHCNVLATCSLREVAIDVPARLWNRANPLGRLAVECRVQSDKRSAVSTNVVLVRTELSALCCDSLELFLGRSICVANIHEKAFLANSNAIKLSNDLVANVSRFESE